MYEVENRMMRRIGQFICALLLCLAAGLLPANGAGPLIVPAALAEEAPLLEIQASAKPDELVEPGDVTLSFTIANASERDAQNVYLSSSDGLLSEPIGQIGAGESQIFTRSHSVTQAELDAGEITYIISHDDPLDPERKVNYTVHASIRQSDKRPQVEFTRQFSNSCFEAGDTVTILYRVRNSGNVAVNALRVEDALGDFTGRVELLDVGESRTLISRVTLSEEAVSAPTLSYVVNALDGAAFTQTLSEATLRLAQPRISARLSADYSPFSESTAEVVLLLENPGDADYMNLRITDDVYGGVIADELQLPAGSEPVAISRSYPVRGDGSFRWRVTGMSASGSRVDFLTNSVTLAPREIGVLADVQLQATATTPRIRRAGTVTVQLRIENAGDADVTELILSEENLGELRSFAIVPAGGAIDCAVALDVRESSAYRFHAQYTDAEGWQGGADSEIVEIAIAPDGVLPEGAKPGFIEFTGSSIKIGGSALFGVLMIAGCVTLVVLIVILAVASHRARVQRQLRIAEEKVKRKEGAGKSRKNGKRPAKPDAKKTDKDGK